jgi:neutral trehalase
VNLLLKCIGEIEALDITFNIKRGKSVWVEGIWFYYDYKDGLIEVYNASINCNSIWSGIKLFEPKKDTYDKIKSEIEKVI